MATKLEEGGGEALSDRATKKGLFCGFPDQLETFFSLGFEQQYFPVFQDENFFILLFFNEANKPVIKLLTSRLLNK